MVSDAVIDLCDGAKQDAQGSDKQQGAESAVCGALAGR